MSEWDSRVCEICMNQLSDDDNYTVIRHFINEDSEVVWEEENYFCKAHGKSMVSILSHIHSK